MPMSRLTREAVLACNVLPTEECECPEWGGTLLVTGMSKGQQQAIIKENSPSTFDNELQKYVPKLDSDKFELALFVASVADPKFEPSDAAIMASLAAAPINRVNKLAMRL